MARDESDEFEDRPRKKLRKKSSRTGKSSSNPWKIAGSVIFSLLIIGGIISRVIRRIGMPERINAINRNVDHRKSDINNLRNIGLALHNYHDDHNSFPPSGIVLEDGTETLSWVAMLLPRLDQDTLAAEIDPDVGWKNPRNQTAYSTTIRCLLNPGIQETPGPGICHYAGNSHLFKINTPLSFKDIPDGVTNTIAVGDVSAGFKQWGDPTNVRDPGLGIGKTPDKFGSPFPGGCHFLMLDGSARFVSEIIDPRTLKALSTPNGGEQVGEF